MLKSGIELMHASNEDPTAGENVQEVSKEIGSSFQDWADEIAIISRRRNLLERKLRGIVANFIRFASLSDPNKVSSKERALKGLSSERRREFEASDLEQIFDRIYWVELITLVKREWPLFEKIFGSQALLDQRAETVNQRPDAHAKNIDVIEIGMQRAAIDWFETRLTKV